MQRGSVWSDPNCDFSRSRVLDDVAKRPHLLLGHAPGIESLTRLIWLFGYERGVGVLGR